MASFSFSRLPGEQMQSGTTGALAQMNTAQITGIVTDPSGAIVPAASVTAVQTATSRSMSDLPLKGREFLELALLSPGVVSPPGGTRGDSLQQTGKLINILGRIFGTSEQSPARRTRGNFRLR
jgi:hypothetical protein